MANGASSQRASMAAFHDPPPRPCPLCADTGVSWRDWAGLTSGPAGLIGERVLAGDVADYVRFRAACRGWRACAADPRAHGVLDRRFHSRQWVMLRETAAAPHRRRLLNLSTGECIATDLPELGGHDVFGPTTEGLLVLLDRATYVVRLLNPITRQAADLPPATTLLSQSKVQRHDTRESLLISGAGLADDSTFAVHFFMIRMLAVVKPGQEHWTVVDNGNILRPTMSFASRFYAATTTDVMVVETGTDQPPRLAVAAKLARAFSLMMMDTVHLVDNDGDLMLVDHERCHRTYTVYRVDLDARKTVPVPGLGGRAAFIDVQRALSISPSVFPSIAADAVYLGFDDLFIGMLDSSPYHLVDGTSGPRDFGYFGFDDLFTGSALDKYWYHDQIIDGTAEPPDHDDSSMAQYGPWGVADYLSSCVTGFRDDSEAFRGYLDISPPC